MPTGGFVPFTVRVAEVSDGGKKERHLRHVLEANVDMTDQANVDHRFFARFYRFMSRHESASLRAWRRENLADLSGRVLEIGAGTGTNFALYPSTVTEVIAIEPERRLTEIARAAGEVRSGSGGGRPHDRDVRPRRTLRCGGMFVGALPGRRTGQGAAPRFSLLRPGSSPALAVVHSGRSGQEPHSAPKRAERWRPERMATVWRAGQVTVPACRSMLNRCLG